MIGEAFDNILAEVPYSSASERIPAVLGVHRTGSQDNRFIVHRFFCIRHIWHISRLRPYTWRFSCGLFTGGKQQCKDEQQDHEARFLVHSFFSSPSFLKSGSDHLGM
jgi:hypothetical protein